MSPGRAQRLPALVSLPSGSPSTAGSWEEAGSGGVRSAVTGGTDLLSRDGDSEVEAAGGGDRGGGNGAGGKHLSE